VGQAPLDEVGQTGHYNKAARRGDAICDGAISGMWQRRINGARLWTDAAIVP
jgi:hypothetical protein